jgi:DNA-binding CsgD family transcriptional regulator
MFKGPQAEPREIAAVERLPFPGNSSDLISQFLLRELLEAYNLVGIGLAIVDAEQRLLESNRVAGEILARRDGLELASDRTLITGRRRGGAAPGVIDQLRDATIYYAQDQEQMAIVAVPRPSGKRPLTVLVPLASLLPNSLHVSPHRSQQVGGAATLVFIVDPELPMAGMDRHVQQVYRLTAAETELATLLMQGHTLPECCQQMGIRRSTAASHLRQLFNKTQARTQGQLVSVLFRRFGLLSSPASATNSRPAETPTKTIAFPPPTNAAGARSFAVSFIRR